MSRIAFLCNIQKEIVELKRLRNSVAHINSLPAELFVEIFAYLVDVHPAGANNDALIRATHVCIHWRTVALDAAKLWTAFPIHDDSAAEEFLRRSRSLPITLDLKSTATQSTHTIACLIAPQIHRVRALRLTFHNGLRLRHLLNRFRAPAPILEELHIEKTRSSRRLIENPLAFHSLFAGDVPSLRTLTLINVDLSVQLPSPSSLAHLSIRSNNELASKELLDLLDCCPLLETFIFAGAPGFDPDGVRVHRVVTLSKLKHLDLNFASPRRTAALLSHLSIPPFTRLRVKTRHDRHIPGAVEGYTMLPTNAKTQLKCLVGIRRLEALYDDNCDFILRAYQDPEAFSDPVVELIATTTSDTPDVFMGDWPFDVSQVEMLVVSGLCGPTMSSGRWALALSELSELKCLRVVAIDAVAVTALLEMLAETTAPESRFVVCRKLCTLELFDIPASAEMSQCLLRTVLRRSSIGTLKEVELFGVGGLQKGSIAVRLMQHNYKGVVVKVDES